MDPDPALWLARDMAHWRDHGFGPWVLFDACSGEFVGRAGLGYMTLEDRQVVELAWALMPARWGEGLASEAALRALEFARELSLAEVVCFTIPSNRASLRVIEKTGLRFVGEITRMGLPHVLFKLKL